MRRERGFALLIVLWSMVLLGLLGTRITAAGRTDATEAEAVAAHATLQAHADAAVDEALFDLATGAAVPPGVTVENEAGRINVNTAPTGLLAALLLALGLPADRAQSLAAAISDWHTPGDLAQPFGAKLAAYRMAGLDYGPRDAPFESVAELGLVLGMTPEILALIEPHVTVFTEGDVDRNLADDVVRTALGRYSGNIVPAGITIPPLSTIYRVTAHVTQAGAHFSRAATVRISKVGDREDPLMSVLEWR